ncbi:PREDICTED: uncharacterized protein LOC109208464 isoform X2 [Nicotiana attenuata]|uniref:uncharacterized protein LOC109208464 isoform X2 n=1 Tax=Nicotiana attenuata TaxID=49451 RepID=UPI0009046A35|nr:PREDICTED: uncharacterized protein LOC109208464 isoform X2 [Nicotiana attenuata]
MEHASELATDRGTTYSNLKKAFVIGVHPLLTSCSREFGETFPNFAPAEVECLHRVYVQVITCLYESIEDEFESLCEETQVGTTLSMVKELVEEQAWKKA